MEFQHIEPVVPLAGGGGVARAAACRVSPDVSTLAFWVAEARAARGLYVGELEWGADIGEGADRIWAGAEGVSASELAWSADGGAVAMRLESGPPPGDVRVGVVRLASRSIFQLPGMSFAWTSVPDELLIVDPAAARVYVRDVATGDEQFVGKIVDDGDPHFAPTIGASADGRRFAIATRRVGEDGTFVDLIERGEDGQWRIEAVGHLPGAAVRLLPFWSADGRALALMAIDLGRRFTSIASVAATAEGAGSVFYTSATVDGLVTPAAHPDGRIIAMVRDHPDDQVHGQAEVTSSAKRLVLLDPVERAVAAVPRGAADVRHLRWLDAETLLAEGERSAWTVRLKLSVVDRAADDEG